MVPDDGRVDTTFVSQIDARQGTSPVYRVRSETFARDPSRPASPTLFDIGSPDHRRVVRLAESAAAGSPVHHLDTAWTPALDRATAQKSLIAKATQVAQQLKRNGGPWPTSMSVPPFTQAEYDKAQFHNLVADVVKELQRVYRAYNPPAKK